MTHAEFYNKLEEATIEELKGLLQFMYGYTEARSLHDKTEEARLAAKQIHEALKANINN